MRNEITFPSLDDFISQTQEKLPISAIVEPVKTESIDFPTIQADSLDINKRKTLGTVCAELYIASQGLCIQTSDRACEIAKSKIDDMWFRYGFNERMSQSEYGLRLDIRDKHR